jgi:GT2 family glycosyltransferase
MLDVCLTTLLASESVDLDVIVVLNGCDEELPDVAHASSRVHVISTGQPVGFSAANNLGTDWSAANLGRPDYFYFINNDTRSEADSLALQVAALEADRDAAVVGPTLLIDWAPEYLNSLCLNVTDDAWGWDEGIGISLADYGPLPGRRRVTAVTGSAMLVDAEVYERVGGWTELYDYYFEDIDLCLKIRGAGHEVIHEPAAVVGHHVSATMTLGSDYKLYLFWRNRLLLAMVHWPPGLLARLFKAAVVDEILRRPRAENALQRRALAGALRKLPKTLSARWRSGGRKSWARLLVPRGSVPVITLPEKSRETGPAEQAPRTPGLDWPKLPDREAEAGARRRVLILGCAPLPFENQKMNYAPGARTWQFARSLAEEGHAVSVIAMRIPGAYDPESATVDRFEESGVGVTTLDHDGFRQPGLIEAAIDALRPDVVIGASSAVPALRAVSVAGDRPVWVDLFGDLMAEAQARLGVHPEEELAPYRDVLAMLLERGDAFSTVSDRQHACVIGQLGLVGRLNRWTGEHRFVHTIPCCVQVAGTDPGGGRTPVTLEDVGDDDFVVLWSGGFNTWCDVDTLFDGVERAVSQNPRVRFVATGGSIQGHDDVTFSRFRDRVENSAFRENFVIKGPLAADLAAAYRRRADLGVVTEKDLTERFLGSSGRILQWIEDGLPVLCTSVSELGSILAANGLAAVYEVGNPEDFARVILEAASDPETARARAARGRRYALEHWSVSATTAPLRRWVRNGGRAPDAGFENPLSVVSMLAAARQASELRVELDQERRNYHQVRSELGLIHQSRMWKIWMFYLRSTGIFSLRRASSGATDEEEDR